MASLPPEPRNPEYSEDFLAPGMPDSLVQRLRDIDGYSDAALYMRSQVISVDEAVDVLDALLRSRTRTGGNVETKERIIDIGHLVSEIKRGHLNGRPIAKGHYITTVRSLMAWIESGGSAPMPLVRQRRATEKVGKGADITSIPPPDWM